MAGLSDFHFDEDGWVRSTCLHRGGLPVLLWEMLQEFGHTEPPQYYGRVSSMGSISRWETRLQVPALSGLVPSDPWEVHADEIEISDAWDRTAAIAITQFCEEQPIFTSFSSVVAFPTRDRSSEFLRQRIDLLLDTTVPGHVPALAKLTCYAAGLLDVCDNLRGENVLYGQGLQAVHIHGQVQTQQIQGQSQQLSGQSQQVVWLAQQLLEHEQKIAEQALQIVEQSQQLAEQAQQSEELTEQVDNQDALVEHLEDEL